MTIKLDTNDLVISIKQDQTDEQLKRLGSSEHTNTIYIPVPDENNKTVLVCDKTVLVLAKRSKKP